MSSSPHTTLRRLLPFFLVGVAFGFTLVKGEVVSWFRIQEMFRLQGFHMYGVFMTAVPTAARSLLLIRRLGLRDEAGEPLDLPPKEMGTGARYVIGGGLFGVGWALTGACPGPFLALTGAGVTVMAAAIASAVVGTWIYGLLRHRLPH